MFVIFFFFGGGGGPNPSPPPLDLLMFAHSFSVLTAKTLARKH